MLCLVLFSLAAVASCAPLGEQETYIVSQDANSVRVKKADEIITYGNEQNLPSKDRAKRTDPALDAASNVDVQGEVKALDPVDLRPILDMASDMNMEHGETDSADDTSADDDQQILQTLSEHNMNNEHASDDAEPEAAAPDTSAASSDTSSEEAAEDADGKNVVDDEETASDDVSTESDDADYMNYLDSLNSGHDDDRSLRDYIMMLGGPRPSYVPRYRRSQVRALNGRPLMKRAVKRSRRMKRDLFYPGQELGEEYEPYVQPYADAAYDPYPSQSQDDYSYLLDLLDSARNEDAYEQPYGSNTFDGYEYIPDDTELYQEYPSNYLQKRQGASRTYSSGLNWYPYFEEPRTHFSAFVPQKRGLNDYAQEYERVMQLAAALRAQNEYPANYYGDYIYRRRK